jgi:hypothetical protein
VKAAGVMLAGGHATPGVSLDLTNDNEARERSR